VEKMTELTFAQVVDIEQIQRLLEAHYKVVGISSAILDDHENILAAAGWQDICTCFHRGHYADRERCRESNAHIKGHLSRCAGECPDYTCKNGLRNMAVPIVIAGKHLATFLTGQFFYDDEKPDIEYFRLQAREFGFDEEKYLDALTRIPVFTREQSRNTIDYCWSLVNVMAEMGRKNLELAQEMKERKRAEEALRQSETTLRKIFETIPDQLHYIDKDFRILRSNWHGGYEYVPEEKRMQNPYCYEAFYGLDGPCENCQAIEVFQTGKPVIREKFNPNTGYVEIRAYPVFDASGDVEMVLEQVCDINERRLAEAKWRTLYENLPGGSFTVNDQYVIEDVNDVLCAVTGFTREELVGQRCGIICPKGPHLCPIFDLGKERIDNDETAVKGKDGRRVPIIKSARRIPEGKREIIVENFQDITDRKHLEEQLRHAQKMDAVGQLAGGVAHDFNNILTAIIGYGNLLQMKIGNDEPLGKYAKNIVSSAERATSLTSSLLAFSRKHVVDLKLVRVNEIIEKAQKLLSRLVPEDIELRVVTGGDFVVRADTIQVEQVMMNLVTNARDAMPEGGYLTISTELTSLDEEFIRTHGYGEPGTYVRISVADTGVGMDAQARERVFEPFYTTKEVGKGTGLGLSIVYGIVKQHDGYIDVSSEPGEGTTFLIYLPAIRGESDTTEKPETEAPPPGSETVLLAEDEPMVRCLVKSMLEEFGYKVVEAADGSDAIEKFGSSEGEIKLLILDVIMPKKNGKEVYDEIKKRQPDMEALFMSGYTDDILSRRGILEENLNFISKPLTQDALLQKVRRILDRQTAAGNDRTMRLKHIR
jgi:two-component system cell cycle sensor histidine kinase/response regulator CckA